MSAHWVESWHAYDGAGRGARLIGTVRKVLDGYRWEHAEAYVSGLNSSLDGAKEALLQEDVKYIKEWP